MGLLATIFLPRKVVARCVREVLELRELVQRLEIRVKELSLDVEVVSEQQLRLVKRAAGRAGGRPAHPADVASATGSLDSVPVGDKAALRAHFASQLTARARGDIPRE